MWYASSPAFGKRHSYPSRLHRATAKPRRRTRPGLEALEDRLALSALLVTTNQDSATTPGTLRYEINQANIDGSHGIADSIQFAHPLNGDHFLLQEGALVLTSGANVTFWPNDPSEPGNDLQIDLNGDAGNIFQVNRGATLVLNELTLAGGDATAAAGANGGAINNAGTLTIAGCNFVNNTASGMGGAIYNTGTVAGTYGSTFTGNSAELGGAIANAAGGNVSFSANFSSNSASGNFGGAIYNDGTMSVGGTFDGNSVQYDGGAIYNDGAMTVASSTLVGNRERDTLGGNGGAIYNDGNGTMTVSSSTLANNQSVAGGAINNGGTLTLAACTVSGNSAVYAGGITNLGSMTLVDTIVAGNVLTSSSGKDPDISGSVTTASANNLIGNGTGLSGISNGVNHNQVGTSGAPINPRLAALASSGGSGETMAPLAGSPAIKAGGAVTTLTGDITAQQTVIYVADAAAIASTAQPTMIEIDDEFLEVTNVNLANNSLTVVRDAAPIPERVDTSHSAGAAVYLAWGSAWGVLVTDPDIGASQPAAGPVTSFSVTGPSSAGVVAGSTFNVTITAEDANGDPELTGAWPITLTASDGQTVHSSPITLSNGTATVGVTLDKAEKLSLTAASGSITGTSSPFTVNAAAPVSFTVSAPSTVTAGASFSLKVTALDAYGNIATKYGGTATLTTSDGQSVYPNSISFNSFGETPAVATENAVLDKVNTLTIKATVGSITGTSNKITVNPAAAARFTLSAGSSVLAAGSLIAGVAFPVKVTALDAYGNVATGYRGTATLTSGDEQAVYPSTVSFGSFGETPGVATVSTILDLADTTTLTATAGAVDGTSNKITINAAATAKFEMVPDVNSVTAGTSWSLMVLAVDAFDNLTKGYAGTATLTTSDGQSVSPSSIAFNPWGATPGIVRMPVTLNEPDTVTITATAGSVTGTSSTITVLALTAIGSPPVWSGYASTPGSGVNAVGASWVQPAVTGSGNSDSSIWVGIDGWNTSTVEQCGVQAYLDNGTPKYTAWWEFWGDQSGNNNASDYSQQNLPSSFVVNPGDTITAQVSFVPGGNSRTFLFQMTDTTPGGTRVEIWSQAETMQDVTPPRTTAEWIVENPNGGAQPLADFGQVTFTGAWATVGSTSGPINPLPNLEAISIVVGNSPLATPSNPPVLSNSRGFGEPPGLQSSSFTVTYDGSNSANSANAVVAKSSANGSGTANDRITALADAPAAPARPTSVPSMPRLRSVSPCR